MILEHDWKLIENKETTSKRLKSGIDLLNNGFSKIWIWDGMNHFTFKYRGRELDYYDEEIECMPHLLDSVHWC